MTFELRIFYFVLKKLKLLLEKNYCFIFSVRTSTSRKRIDGFLVYEQIDESSASNNFYPIRIKIKYWRKLDDQNETWVKRNLKKNDGGGNRCLRDM